MESQNSFKVEAEVITILPNEIYGAKLENGHEVIAFFDKKRKNKGLKLEIGKKISLELSAYDLTQGRIVSK